MRRPSQLVATAMGAVLLMAACGNQATSPSAESSEPNESAAEASTPASQAAQQGGTLTVSQGADPRTLDPLSSTFTFDQNVYGQINETLLVFSPDLSEIRPHLATDVSIVDDTTWAITLREGVTFHNGEVMDAEAVRYSLERLIAAPAYSFWTGVLDGVEVIDDLTVHLTTKSPAPYVPALLARSSWIYPPQYAEEAGEDFANNPVGTGPYKFVEWVRDDQITLEAFDDYWGGAPALDTVVFRPIPEAAARVAALQAGEVDLIYQLPVDLMPSVEGDSNLVVESAPGMRVYVLFFEYLEGDTPLADPLVRQALNYAIDKESIINSLFSGQAEVLPGQHLSPAYFGSNPDLDPFPYNPDRARELLAEAGYPDGFETTLNSPIGRFTLDSDIAEILVAQLAEVGVRAELVLLEPGEFAERSLATEMGPMYYAGTLTPPDAFFMYSVYGEGSPYRHNAANPEYDELIQAAAEELDTDTRLDLYHQAAELAHEDPYAAYLWTINELYGVNARVQGWTPNWDESLSLIGVSVSD